MKLLLVAFLLMPSSAQAFSWRDLLQPFRTPAERFVEQAREARQRGELDAASALLDEAERASVKPLASVARERAALMRGRGRIAEAVPFLERAAELEPSSDARLEQAVTLVELGRWPEAVEVLSRAFDERGAALRVDAVVQDLRFAPLVGFAPYEKLLERVRQEQAGPIGRLFLKLERLEASVRTADEVLTDLGTALAVATRLWRFVGTPVILLVLLGIFLTAGVNQLGLMRPPWPLAIGMTLAAGLWHLGARIASADQESGLGTIASGYAVVFTPWVLAMLGRLAVRRLRRRRERVGSDSVAHEEAERRAS